MMVCSPFYHIYLCQGKDLGPLHSSVCWSTSYHFLPATLGSKVNLLRMRNSGIDGAAFLRPAIGGIGKECACGAV